MSKEERTKLVVMAMVEGYKLGEIGCPDLIPPIKNKHLKDMHDADSF
jgi:hypothetical protein